MRDEIYEPFCEQCSERDVAEALIPVYVATPQWHRMEVLVHPECRAPFVAANLPAVLESLRLVAQASEARAIRELDARDCRNMNAYGIRDLDGGSFNYGRGR
jgi:hypothetical protein